MDDQKSHAYELTNGQKIHEYELMDQNKLRMCKNRADETVLVSGCGRLVELKSSQQSKKSHVPRCRREADCLRFDG